MPSGKVRVGLFVDTVGYSSKQEAVEGALSKMAECIPMHQIKLDTDRAQTNFQIDLTVGSDFVSVKTQLDKKPDEAS